MPLPIGLRRRAPSTEDTNLSTAPDNAAAPGMTMAVAIAAGAATIAVGLTAWYDESLGSLPIDWLVFGVIAGLLLICEITPVTWIRIGPNATVTPVWMFALALLLLGSPTMGIAVALVGVLGHGIKRPLTTIQTIERVAVAGLSLSAAALALRLLGVQEAITGYERIPWTWALGIVLAGLAIVLTNAMVATALVAFTRRRTATALFRRTLGTRVTAEGALLSLAPIWVIGIDFSPVLAPLLGVTTILVFRSTREALERSHEAQHDALTGLPNRRAFLDELDDAVGANGNAGGRAATVLLFDLDGFKEVNDHLGHAVGDALLIAFSDRLVRAMPPSAATARLGGDEFAALLPRDVDPRDVVELVDRLHARLSAPLIVDGFPISNGVSVGSATYPEDGSTPADLLRAADVAMYRSKRAGRSAERHLQESTLPKRSRLALLGDIGTALDRGDLHVNFQPQIRLSDGEADTVEALVRWHHPEHGPVPPQEFIGLAEQTDLIAPITRVVLQQATRGLLGTGASNVRLAVNVSPRSLVDPRFAQSVFEVLEETRFPAELLELEITERALISHPERSAVTIERLRGAGVRIALDDFGAGYSSYQTLRVLDVDRVKIDSAFVGGVSHSARDRSIVRSLVELAHELGFDVVGEGVESEDVYDALSALGCDLAQGYFIAVPMGVNELGGWLNSWRTRGDRTPLRLVR